MKVFHYYNVLSDLNDSNNCSHNIILFPMAIEFLKLSIAIDEILSMKEEEQGEIQYNNATGLLLESFREIINFIIYGIE